jgi:hypothetical protein
MSPLLGSAAAAFALGWAALRPILRTACLWKRLVLIAALFGTALLAAFYSADAAVAGLAGLLFGAYAHRLFLASLQALANNTATPDSPT